MASWKTSPATSVGQPFSPAGAEGVTGRNHQMIFSNHGAA
jgi:hypothetical protein